VLETDYGQAKLNYARSLSTYHLREPDNSNDIRATDDVFGRKGVFFMRGCGFDVGMAARKNLQSPRRISWVENIPDGGYIIAAKHQSFLETFSLLKYSPDFAIIMKKH